jgi:predicted nucleic-acid-binding Zn-ribbon protein
MAQEPFTATAGDRPIRCLHCGNTWFWHRRIVMSSGSATLFGVDAFSPEAAVLSCTGCGRIELFEPDAVRLFRQVD